jgi:hypothetical protein
MLLTGTDHTRCPRSAHRTVADPTLLETPDGGGQMRCAHCGTPLAHCATVAAANTRGREYERAYFHPNRRDEENCT